MRTARTPTIMEAALSCAMAGEFWGLSLQRAKITFTEQADGVGMAVVFNWPIWEASAIASNGVAELRALTKPRLRLIDGDWQKSAPPGGA